MLRSLHRLKDFEEICGRIDKLSENSSAKWGKMNVPQMLKHCTLVLEVPLQKTILPKKNFLIKTIGILTKKEMKLFKNGIPPNMPTFEVLRAENQYHFQDAKEELLFAMKEYLNLADSGKLPENHELFGKMEPKDWGFLEYKHLHHHLKQFGV